MHAAVTSNNPVTDDTVIIMIALVKVKPFVSLTLTATEERIVDASMLKLEVVDLDAVNETLSSRLEWSGVVVFADVSVDKNILVVTTSPTPLPETPALPLFVDDK